MRTMPIALALALLAALGCRSNNGQVLVEQEARMWEDEVYRLEAQLDACCREKQALEQENAALRGGGTGTGGGSSGPGGSYRSPAVDMPLPSRTSPRTQAPLLEAPKIELPEPSDTPPEQFIPGNEEPAVIPDGASTGGSGQPATLVINKRLTGGLDRDRTDGDEGIMVMVEPRDASGDLVKAPGAVSVVVMDPQLEGDASRIARWDFQAHEFDDHFRKSAFGQGLQYELNWPDGPPQNRDLVLFVRYVAPDGTKLTSDTPLRVRMASDSPGRTVTREPRSRLKQADSLSREPEDDEEDRSRARREERSPRQARDGRPVWQPYR